jgi:hypothetical protein
MFVQTFILISWDLHEMPLFVLLMKSLFGLVFIVGTLAWEKPSTNVTFIEV